MEPPQSNRLMSANRIAASDELDQRCWDDGTVAAAILDRIVHNAHRIALQGDSMRKQKTPPLLPGGENGEINHP